MIYVDSCLVIFAVERDDDLGRRTREALTRPATPLAISPLVLLESLVGPLRDPDTAARSRMMDALSSFELVPVDTEAYLDAARLRARHRGLATVDALHLAAARAAGCTALWTNDSRLASASGGFAVDVVAGR